MTKQGEENMSSFHQEGFQYFSLTLNVAWKIGRSD